MEIHCAESKEEIYKKIKPKLEHYKETGKWQIKDVEFNDAALKVVAKGPGFTANVACNDGKINVDLELGFLLKPLRSTIEQGIRESFEKALTVTKHG